MTLKAICECSTCACGNAPGRSGYCLNCEVTDSGAEGSHAQPETPGPFAMHYEPTGFGSGKLLLDGEHGPELIGTMNGQGRYNYGHELVIRHNAYPAMLEALRAAHSALRTFSPNVPEAEQGWTSFDSDTLEAIEAAIAAAEGE